MLGEAVIYESLVLIRPADEGPVIRRVGKDVEGLAVFRNLGQLPGGRACSFCCWAVVFGVMVLKPDAISIFCSFAVGVLLAQPRARARSAEALIRLNPVTMCLIDLYFAFIAENLSAFS